MKKILFLCMLLGVSCSKGGGGASSGGGSGSGGSSGTAATSSVGLSWTASSGTVQGYKIEESVDSGSFSQVKSVGAVTSTTISGLTLGHSYTFRVRAFNQGGNSGYTSSVTVSL